MISIQVRHQQGLCGVDKYYFIFNREVLSLSSLRTKSPLLENALLFSVNLNLVRF